MNVIIGVKNLAELLNVSRQTVYVYIKKGMPCKRISDKKIAFNKEEVEKWLTSKK